MLQLNTVLLREFIAMSAELCGFSAYVLRGTGYSEEYYGIVAKTVGEETMDELVELYAALPTDNPTLRDKAIRLRILGDPKLGPVARNIIKLWYTSIWFELPKNWHDV